MTSSITAAIAVLNAKRPAMSLVTLSIAQCALRISSRSSPSGALERAQQRLPAGRSATVRAQPPQPAQEAVHALDALVGPVGVLVGRRR